jgi:hypothetical protein
MLLWRTSSDVLIQHLSAAAVSFSSHRPELSYEVLMSQKAINEQRSWPLQSVQGAYDALVNLGNTPAPQRRE